MEPTYYKHIRPTITLDFPCKHHYDATIAARVEGDTVVVGITICSHHDQFSKKLGRIASEERMTYCPTFKFPALFKEDIQSIRYWFNSLTSQLERSGEPIKNHITRIQAKFDITVTGIRLKMNKEKAAAEVKAAKKKRKAELKAAHEESKK